MSTDQEDPFKKYVSYSLIGHIIVFALFTVKAYVFPSEPIEMMSSIRVDVVGLPDKVEPKKPKPKPKPKKVAAKKPKPKPKPKPKKKPKPKVDLNKTKSSQQKALERLKALEAIEKMKKEVSQSEQAAAEQAEPAVEEAKPQEFRGNVITSGSSLSGLDRIAFERYYDDMSTHIKSHWSLPGWLANADLKAEAAVTIDERGYVTSKRIYASSGNQVFDDLVLETVEKASPFPAPPSRLKSVLALKGMILGFPR